MCLSLITSIIESMVEGEIDKMSRVESNESEHEHMRLGALYQMNYLNAEFTLVSDSFDRTMSLHLSQEKKIDFKVVSRLSERIIVFISYPVCFKLFAFFN